VQITKAFTRAEIIEADIRAKLWLATVEGPGCTCTFPDIINSNTIKARQRTGRALQCRFVTSECASDGNKIILYSNFIR
jgi:hypothetical protein